MPYKPKKPCAYPGCPKLTSGRYCEDHADMEQKPQRETAVYTKRYGEQWKKIRKRYAQAHPMCEQCLKSGIYRETEEIHHVKPLSEGGTHDESNLIALCKECHARTHAKRGDRWKRKVYTY